MLEEFVKAESNKKINIIKDLYGADLEDRKRIFKNILSDEEFIDRRINISELIEPETESDNDENIEFFDKYKFNTFINQSQ